MKWNLKITELSYRSHNSSIKYYTTLRSFRQTSFRHGSFYVRWGSVPVFLSELFPSDALISFVKVSNDGSLSDPDEYLPLRIWVVADNRSPTVADKHLLPPVNRTFDRKSFSTTTSKLNCGHFDSCSPLAIFIFFSNYRCWCIATRLHLIMSTDCVPNENKHESEKYYY